MNFNLKSKLIFNIGFVESYFFSKYTLSKITNSLTFKYIFFLSLRLSIESYLFNFSNNSLNLLKKLIFSCFNKKNMVK